MSHPQYTESEAEQHGRAFYERELQSRFGPEHRGKTLVIDPETEEYEIGGLTEIISRLQAKNPGVHLYALHIGLPGTERLIRRLNSYWHVCYKRDGENPTQAMIDEAQQRGAERYAQIRRQVEPGNERKLVVINTQTGEYTVGNDLPEMLKSIDMSSVITYTHRIGFLGYMSLGYRATLGVLGAKIKRNVPSPIEPME